MADHPTGDDREMAIAGGRAGALEPEEAADVPVLARLLADPSTWASPSPDLEDAVVAAVAEAGPAVAPVAARRRPTPSRRALVALAAAAAVLIIVAAGVVVSSRGGGTGADFTTDLAATELVPGASGAAHITRTDAGFRVDLDVSGLEPLPAGQFYEAWLKDADGTLVPIGTFSSSDDQVTLWSGVSPADFPLLTVTIESTDNDQASSGRVVLAGELNPAS
jgi:Anti-sigma-K factor rskA, C-terminal